MNQHTQLGEAELDSYLKVDRKNGVTEFYHVTAGVNVPISAEAYAAATTEG